MQKGGGLTRHRESASLIKRKCIKWCIQNGRVKRKNLWESKGNPSESLPISCVMLIEYA